MKKGWFDIPGVQKGDRTLEEQLRGLQPALAGVAGKTVLDVGCAEGLIALEMLKAGAASCHGVDSNHGFVEEAQRAGAGAALRVQWCDLNDGLPSWCLPQYDVVLALAILHKLARPAAVAAELAERTRERLVIRLPSGSRGVFLNKAQTARCDLETVLRPKGLRYAGMQRGPRGEMVQHWVR